MSHLDIKLSLKDEVMLYIFLPDFGHLFPLVLCWLWPWIHTLISSVNFSAAAVNSGFAFLQCPHPEIKTTNNLSINIIENIRFFNLFIPVFLLSYLLSLTSECYATAYWLDIRWGIYKTHERNMLISNIHKRSYITNYDLLSFCLHIQDLWHDSKMKLSNITSIPHADMTHLW